jgi:alpha-glucosidase
MCIPVYLTVHNLGSYLVFFENSFPGTFTFPASQSPEEIGYQNNSSPQDAQATFGGGMLRYYFIPGPADRALERYSQLTGQGSLPPRWALGYHQSRWGYQSEAEIREVADGFLQHDLPVSAIHLDIDYMDGYRVFSVDKEKFPCLPGLAEDLLERSIHLVTILDPGIKSDPSYSVFRDGLENQVFCKLPDQKTIQAVVWPGWSVFPDFTDHKVRGWWGSHYDELVSQGISGVWHDMNEPATFSAWGEFTLPATTVHAMEGRGGTHLEAHNLYGLLMNRAGWEALDQIHPDRRAWILTRSGWAGVARYAWSWTGDIESSWEALRQTIRSLLGLSLSGIPYSGSDIGGFSGNPEPELYLRWFQMAVFTPFFRTHSSKEVSPREPWRFGEPFLSIVRESLRLRYRLLPYLYTLAWECTAFGRPLLRPLFWPDAGDSRLWQVEDAFFLGDHLLVAPILEPGVKSRTVTLPAGDWFDFWDETHYPGSTEVEIPANLKRIPVLARGGSLLPLAEGNDMILQIYLAKNGSSQGSLYSDAGDGYGDWRLDQFHVIEFDGGIEVTRTKEGLYDFPYQRLLIHMHGKSIDRAWVDGKESPVSGNVLEAGNFTRIHLQ